MIAKLKKPILALEDKGFSLPTEIKPMRIAKVVPNSDRLVKQSGSFGQQGLKLADRPRVLEDSVIVGA